MNQQSMHEPISLYMPSRTNHVMQSMPLGSTVLDSNTALNNNNNIIVNNNNNTTTNNNNTTFFSEIQMDDGKWTRHQTQVLIDTWKEHKDILLSTASSSAEHFRVWKLIATEVNKFAPPKSLQQCKKKFRNIRYICKMAMNNNKQEGGKKHYPMFYSDFLEIISESERIKEGLKTESPNVEILNESSKDDGNYDNYGHPSPPDDAQMNNSLDVSIRRDEDGDDKRNGVNMSDGSYNDSPQSREAEEFSVSPTNYNDHERTETDRERDRDRDNRERSSSEPLHNGVVESDSNGMVRQKSDEHLTSVHHHYSLYPSTYSSTYSTSSDHVMRRHRNNDVSIMGRGYPTVKRQKRSSESYISSTTTPPYKYAPRNRAYPPTMAHIPANTYPYPSNHYSNSLPIVTQNEFQRKDGSPELIANSSALLMTSHSVSNLTSYSKDSNAHPDNSNSSGPNNSHSRYSLPPLKHSFFNSTANGKEGKLPSDQYTQRFLDIQERQLELFNDMLTRHEQFLLRLLQQQKEAAEEAQKRDREFMLKLIEMFVKH